MPTKGYIYLIRNLLNGKAYIGKTEKSVSLRFSQHKTQSKIGSAYALHAAMRKYGVHNFSIVEIASCESCLLSELETHFIKIHETYAPLGKGYNLTLGGEGQTGLVHSKETRKKLSAITKARLAKNGHPMKGRKMSPEAIEKSRASRKGKVSPKKGRKFGPQSQEVIDKRSASLKGRIVSTETRTKLSLSNRGQKRSEETKRKLSESHQGKTLPSETKSKMSIAQKARWATMSDSEKNNIASKLRGKKAPIRSEEWHRKQSLSQSKPWSAARRAAQLKNGGDK